MLKKSTLKIIEYVCNKIQQYHSEIDDYTVYVESEKVYINFSYHHQMYRLWLKNIVVEVPEMMLRYNGIESDTEQLRQYILRILEKKICSLGGAPLYEKSKPTK